jgi:hypothetical protein
LDVLANFEKNNEPTSGLEPLTCSLRVIAQALQVLARGCKPAFLSDFLCSGLLRVAPYCVPGGIRVVSEVHRSRVANPFASQIRH